ncbi:MAG: hypothetical protein V1914_01340 [archaeon]
MCPLCGGTCGGIENALLVIGLPALAIGYWKIKNSIKKMKHKLKK